MPEGIQARHTARLLETHDIVVPVGGYASVNDCVAVARELAGRWLDAHGLEASITCLSRSDGTAGVTFDVEVGRGDIGLDQTVPGAADGWRWSARWQWWRDLFNRADRRQGRMIARREDGLASVTAIHSDRARAGVTVGAPTGCTCALGGPFRDICPVHYRPGGNT